MFDYILSSEQISFFNGCVRQCKAELGNGICFSTPLPRASWGHWPILGVLNVAWES